MRFGFARIPRIVFGAGSAARLAETAAGYGESALVITGGKSFGKSESWKNFLSSARAESLEVYQVSCAGEPSPEFVDSVVERFGARKPDVTIAWGGGGAIDAGKAISAMLPLGESVLPYLEDVGDGRSHPGVKIPFIAAPTTAGTGAEATKNAVLSSVGPDGFKKSLRHDNFVPDIAIVDPVLALSCPPDVSAACGMDAFTQLLESYVSTAASPMTDALALSGIERAGRSLAAVCGDRAGDVEARADMAFAALMSGVTLANAGLGVVHGLAPPLGGYFKIPHGVVCGTLVAAATKVTIDRLFAESGAEHAALRKYARAGAILSGAARPDVRDGCAALVEILDRWTEELRMPRLGEFGITEADFDMIIAGGDNKNNPATLDDNEIRGILLARL